MLWNFHRKWWSSSNNSYQVNIIEWKSECSDCYTMLDIFICCVLRGKCTQTHTSIHMSSEHTVIHIWAFCTHRCWSRGRVNICFGCTSLSILYTNKYRKNTKRNKNFLPLFVAALRCLVLHFPSTCCQRIDSSIILWLFLREWMRLGKKRNPYIAGTC